MTLKFKLISFFIFSFFSKPENFYTQVGQCTIVNPPVSNNVGALAIDKNGTKWFGSVGAGLLKYNDTTWTIYDTSNSNIPGNNVSGDFKFDSKEAVWYSYGGLVKFDGSNFTRYHSSNSSLPNNFIKTFIIDKYDNKWVSLNEFPGAEFGKFDTAGIWTRRWTPPSYNYVYPLEIEAGEILWYTVNAGDSLVKLNVTTNAYVHYTSATSPVYGASVIAIDSLGNKWIGWDGLAKFDDVNWTIYDTSNSDIPSNSIYQILVDKYNNLWMRTAVPGLVKFDGTNWFLYDKTNSCLPTYNYALEAIDKNDDIWFVGDTPRLFKISGLINSDNSPKQKKEVFQIYPNPSTGKFSFTFPANGFSIFIYDVYSRQVFKKEKNSSLSETIDLSTQSSGVYFVRIANGNQVSVKKIMLE